MFSKINNIKHITVTNNIIVNKQDEQLTVKNKMFVYK